MPYDTYDLLVKKLTKAQVWSLNADELCDEFDKMLESEVQELKDKIKEFEEIYLQDDEEIIKQIEKLQKENEELMFQLKESKVISVILFVCSIFGTISLLWFFLMKEIPFGAKLYGILFITGLIGMNLTMDK